jgi:hypothetical protein
VPGVAPGLGPGFGPVRPPRGGGFAATSEHPLAREWSLALAGARLTVGSGAGRAAADAGSELHLCSDGTFLVRTPRAGAGSRRDGPGGGSLTEGPAWYVVSDGRTSTLVLEGADARGREHDLSSHDGLTYLDGAPVALAATGLCR